VLYLYGITDAHRSPQPLPAGFGGRAVDLHPLDGMAAVISELAQGRPEASERNLRVHFHVVAAFIASHTMLPVRFGTAYEDLAKLTAHLEHARRFYSNDLQRLRGQVEVGIRAIRRGTATAPFGETEDRVPANVGPGARYLAAKRASAAQSLSRQRQVQELAALLIERLVVPPSEVEWHAISNPTGEAGVSAAFLLRRESLPSFEQAVSTLRDLEPDLDVLLTGPWPPYSFVSPPEAANAPLEPS
jgi:hypothetical protein